MPSMAPPPLPLPPLLLPLLLLGGWAAAEESVGAVRHGVCELDIDRLSALEAELVGSIRDEDVRRVRVCHPHKNQLRFAYTTV
jgi:hypothetical protein